MNPRLGPSRLEKAVRGFWLPHCHVERAAMADWAACRSLCPRAVPVLAPRDSPAQAPPGNGPMLPVARRLSGLCRSQLTSPLTSLSGAKPGAPFRITPSKDHHSLPPHQQAPRHCSPGVTSAPARQPQAPRASLGTSPQQSMGAAGGAQGASGPGGFFADISELIPDNTPELRYGVCAGDLDADGQPEFFVCGFGSRNRLLKWSASEGRLEDSRACSAALADEGRMSIGVAAGDFDGDGEEEIYVLNTDTFGGRKRYGDRLFDRQANEWVDLLSLPQNLDDANVFAGRSVCAVDRFGSGRYGFFVANYGGLMKLFELTEGGFVADVAREAGLATYPTGGRALVSLPLVSHSAMDIFAGNEGGPNFLFVNKGNGSGQFVESAAEYGLLDPYENCRGVAAVDAEGTGELGLCTGNWEGPHRLFQKGGPGPRGGARALGFTGVGDDAGGFADVAPAELAEPTRVRTVIAADLDNDGYEELFFNNIGSRNKLFRQAQPGQWEEVPLGVGALPQGLGTGAAVADIDGDGLLELLIAHGESGRQPMALLRCGLEGARSNAWLRVQPLTKQGAPARGATVRVKDSTGRWQKRAIDAGSGYLCCMEPVAHFGFGALHDSVDLRVTWPEGSIKDMSSISVNQMLQVPHPGRALTSS